MIQTQRNLLFKLSIYCILATGIGYSIMYMTTPSRDQMLQEFSEERRHKIFKDQQFQKDQANKEKVIETGNRLFTRQNVLLSEVIDEKYVILALIINYSLLVVLTINTCNL